MNKIRSVSNAYREAVEDAQYLKVLDSFLSLPSVCGITESIDYTKDFDSIRFENVFFKYPKTDQYVLQDISFTLQKGNHYALVGENGSGKTTLIKLLTGLYKPTSGTIYINDMDIQKLKINDISGMVCCINQDFGKYDLSIAENISISNCAVQDTERIQECTKKANCYDFIESLPKGFSTALGKIEQDGIELSGGEWQKIALARILYSPAKVKVLDEPTAALDPISEANLYVQYHSILSGNTGLMISHRLGAAKLADIIFVLHSGRIIEQGSHQELMAKKGVYEKMFQAQKNLYTTDVLPEVQ